MGGIGAEPADLAERDIQIGEHLVQCFGQIVQFIACSCLIHPLAKVFGAYPAGSGCHPAHGLQRPVSQKPSAGCRQHQAEGEHPCHDQKEPETRFFDPPLGHSDLDQVDQPFGFHYGHGQYPHRVLSQTLHCLKSR